MIDLTEMLDKVIEEPAIPAKTLAAWLNDQPAEQKTLLAFTHQGAVWGTLEDGQWHLSGDLNRPEDDQSPEFPRLAEENLLELRVFGDAGETMLWRTEEGFAARRIDESEMSGIDRDDEIRIIWGNWGYPDGRFTVVEDGRQGLRHAVPVRVTEAFDFSDRSRDGRPFRLHVRHYIYGDADTGLARIGLSRLVCLSGAPKKVSNDNT